MSNKSNPILYTYLKLNSERITENGIKYKTFFKIQNAKSKFVKLGDSNYFICAIRTFRGLSVKLMPPTLIYESNTFSCQFYPLKYTQKCYMID